MPNNIDQRKLVDILNEYLSNLKVLNNNLYNLHFNVIGTDFFVIHEKLEEYYKKVAEMYDEVAERIKMYDEYPITSLVKYEEVSTIKSMRSQDYNIRQIYNILINDFSFMVGFSKEVGDLAALLKDEVTLGMMIDYTKFFEKQLWMLRVSNK